MTNDERMTKLEEREGFASGGLDFVHGLRFFKVSSFQKFDD
jgi:hypothetical protein